MWPAIAKKKVVEVIVDIIVAFLNVCLYRNKAPPTFPSSCYMFFSLKS